MRFGRVHPLEWLSAACGVLILAGLVMPWYGDQTGIESVSLLDVILVLAAVSAVLLPVVLAVTTKTDIPIVFETFLSTLALLAAVVLAVKLVFRPEGGVERGFLLGLIGAILLSWAGWRSTSREN
ncbi:MAG: hypothetical protein ACSLFD_02425 [Solirubrobacterales bacterium]